MADDERFLGAPIRTVMLSQVHPGPQYHVPRLWMETHALQWVEHYCGKLRVGEKLDPIIIDARFFIVDGHRRWRAPKPRVAGSIPASPANRRRFTVA